jgi:hypothetical protein
MPSLLSSNFFEFFQKIQPESRTATVFVTAVCGILLHILVPSAVYSTSSYEQHIVWECLTIGGSKSINCVQVDGILEAPILPILSGFLSLFLPPIIAIGILIWIFSLWTIGLIWKLGSVMRGFWGGICSLTLFFSIAVPTNVFSLVTPEIVITPFLLTILLIFIQHDPHRSKNVAPVLVGLFLGFSYLMTSSVFLYMLGICGIAFFTYTKKDTLLFVSGCCVFPLLWHLVLSIYTNSLFLNPSYVDSIYTSTHEILPDVFLRQLFGEGIFETALRNISRSELTPITFSSFFAFDTQRMPDQLYNIFERIPVFIPLCLIILLVNHTNTFYPRSTQDTQIHSSFGILIILGIVQVGCTEIQDAFLFFLPAVGIGSVVIGIFLTRIHEVFLLKNSFRVSLALLLGIAVAIGISSKPKNLTPKEQSPSGRAMTDWISQNTLSNESIVSTRNNTPLIYLANRKWIQYKSPFERMEHQQNPPKHILLSKHDKWFSGDVRGIGKNLVYFSDEKEWFGIFEIQQ